MLLGALIDQDGLPTNDVPGEHVLGLAITPRSTGSGPTHAPVFGSRNPATNRNSEFGNAVEFHQLPLTLPPRLASGSTLPDGHPVTDDRLRPTL